jgi:UPF0489 domain
MYQEKKIITTPISNNRLNFDERVNRIIVVPSLITGTLDDVVTGTETVIEAEVDWKIIAGKWLQHFVFLRNSRVPTWIMDNHNHAFAFWHEAYWKWWIQKWALLVHIDQHTDLATPMALPIKRAKSKEQNDGSFIKNSNIAHLWKGESKEDWIETVKNPPFWILPFEFWTLEEVEDYTNSVLTIADFIVPALSTGLISEALMVTGEDMHTSRSFAWEKNKEELKKKKEENFLKDPQLCSLNFALWTSKSLIVDIDLDYFSQGFDELKCFETVRYWIEKADIITIATSPLFIDQEKALSYLRQL